MKKLALQAAAISVALVGTASAADMRMPVKAPAPVAVAAYNWSGCYVGGGGGYGMFHQESTRYAGTPPVAVGSSWDTGGSGWFGTVQVGCDFQLSSSIVIGAFADYNWSGIEGDLSHPQLGWVGEEKLKNSWAAGGRIGWVPWSSTQLLVFVSGGYTQATFGAVNFQFAGGGGATGFVLGKNTYDGWFIGSGYEYGLSWLPISGLFWKTEYRFADYGSERINVTFNGAATADYIDSRKYVQTIRSELVWRFNWSSPVVARY